MRPFPKSRYDAHRAFGYSLIILSMCFIIDMADSLSSGTSLPDSVQSARRRIMSGLKNMHILTKPTSGQPAADDDFVSSPTSLIGDLSAKVRHHHDSNHPQAKGHEDESEAHRLFRAVAGHAPSHRQTRKQTAAPPPAQEPSKKDGQPSRQKQNIEESRLIDHAAEPGQDDDVDENEPLPGIAPPGSTGGMPALSLTVMLRLTLLE